MNGHVIDDWARLVGAEVEVRQSGSVLRRGRVETATTDSKVAWIEASGAETRMMVEKSRGHELTIRRWTQDVPHVD